jgi:hypothetical protein
MATTSFSIRLSKDEERIAQLLTRDAWVYFSSLISSRDLFHVKEIPMMPRSGSITIVADEEVVQYYLDFSSAYEEELALAGWEVSRSKAAARSFCVKLQDISGQVAGAGRRSQEAVG